MAEATQVELKDGSLVAVRGRRWVVSECLPGSGSTVLTLQSVEEGRYGETLEVVWEIEPGREILPERPLPDVTAAGFDPPRRLAAFLDAVRWSAVTSADLKTLQAPFRSGVAIEDYQLEPVARAVDAPRVNLLLADDVGLGKTIEAGLVAEELLLRHRARRIMVVCPAGLTTKWHDEMAEKFGLEFTVIDSERCAIVRRERGSAANPFHIYPLTIVSLPWLRGQKAQRLLDELLPAGEPGTQRFFDLLILDEAHHVAPAAPKQRYAVDSQQTKLIRRLAPHFTHRLFLSATPHNGYLESFTALLEILDDQRFARGMRPDRAAVQDTVVRRLKRDIVEADGTPRFAQREALAIPVSYPQGELEIHAVLKQFAKARRDRLTTQRGQRATDLVTLLLKKRLFSSPAAFGRTVEVYTDTLRAKTGKTLPDTDSIPEWMDDFLADTATLDDDEFAEAETDAIGRLRPMLPDATASELELLDHMARWAATHEARPDAKADALIGYLNAVCRDAGTWLNERVVVFTEYRDTQDWLAGLLRQEGLAGIGGERLRMLNGGTPSEEREQIRLAFQANPAEHPVRILLATDAASEGIDLQERCHRLVNYDIPFNPNKLEQRIGRIDRYGQKQTSEVRHFVGTGWEGAVDSFEADLEFLSRVAIKVARMEEDLGSVNAVLADAVQRRMLGDTRVDVEAVAAVKAKRDELAESNVGEQVRRLRTTIEETVQDLGITPEAVKRVVDTAMELQNQQPLRPYLDDQKVGPGLYEVPPLTGSWQRATVGLTEKLRRPNGEPPKQMPITFDHRVAQLHEDVVLAHLGHPLVTMSTRLLGKAVYNQDVGLYRVAAVIGDHPRQEKVLLAAYSRFVIVGADGVRLHEEVLYSGGWLEESRFQRLENLGILREILGPALANGLAAAPELCANLAEQWPKVSSGLVGSIKWRQGDRQESLTRKLSQLRDSEEKRINANLDRFGASLREAIAVDEEDALFSRFEAERGREELSQYRRDRQSWQDRLASLEHERRRELDAIEARYRDPQTHLFPVAVVFVVPRAVAQQ